MFDLQSRRRDAFWLALVIAGIHAGLIVILVVIAWRSPFVLFRLPAKSPVPAQAAHSP